MGCARTRDDDVDRIKGAPSSVRVSDCHLRPQSERDTCLLGEAWIDFDRCDLARRSNKLGGDRGGKPSIQR